MDKWDYFLRDDYYLKIGHVFQHSWLIDNCQVLEIGPNKRKRICFRDNVEEKILEIYQDRARLHRHGYQHRVALIAERMTVREQFFIANTNC